MFAWTEPVVHLLFVSPRETVEMDGTASRRVTGAAASKVGSSDWAARHAKELLAELPKRWAHTQEVARHARWAATGVRPDEAELLVAAAFLHDIGYAKPIAHTGFHPLDGAVHLRELGLDELARLVAHHSGAHVEARHRRLAVRLAEFPGTSGPVSDALTYSDVTSGPTGQAMQPGDRFEEIIDRHGQDSVVARSRSEARAELYGSVVRTLRRATRNYPLQSGLAIGAVQLGCATLLRLRGSVDHRTADKVDGALADVLDREPHGLVLDMALVTFMDSAGAAVLVDLPERASGVRVTFLDPRDRDHALLTRTSTRPVPIVFGADAAVQPHCRADAQRAS